MIDWILIILYVLMTVFNCIYYWHKLLKVKPNYKDNKLYLMGICLFIVYIFNQVYVNRIIKMSIVMLSTIILCKIFMKKDLKRSIITPVIFQITVMLAEMISVIILMLVFNVTQEMLNSQEILFICTAMTTLLVFLQSNAKWYGKLYEKIISCTDKIPGYQLIRTFLILVLSASILINIIFYDVAFEYVLLLNSMICVIFVIITISDIISKNNYKKVYDKYNTTSTSLREYESILDKYRSLNHENKNELMTIRSMTTNKKIKDYIDSILKYRIKDNEILMKEIVIIPSGGLRGLIYSKLSLIKSNGIKYQIYVDKEVKTVDLIGISNNLMLQVCKVIGVFIDNAIEETLKLKEGYIEISMFIDDNKLNISITNNYEGNIDLSKIDEAKYTTKEKGHGYGLTLVKDIIKSEKLLENEREITDETFTQILKIKM